MTRPLPPSPDRLGIIAVAGLLLSTFANPSNAQILTWPPEDTPPPKSKPAAEKEIQVLQIQSAPEPEPALRYRFWPRAGEETPGNAMFGIQRANVMRLEQRANHSSDALFENYEQWMHAPLEDLPREEVRKYLEENAAVLAEVHRVASMKDSDYAIGLENLHGGEVISIPLNELQNARDLTRLLALEIRLALSEQRYEDAIRSMQAGFRVADAVASATDLIVGRLIGFALARHMLTEVQELIAQPESPNLYWALASLPPSIWEMRRAVEFESNLTHRFSPRLRELTRDTTLSDPGWRDRLIDAVDQFISIVDSTYNENQQRIRSQLMAGILVVAFTGSEEVYLQQIGYKPEAVEAMSPSEVVLRGTRERLERAQDRYIKWALMPRRIAENYWPREEFSGGGFTNPAMAMLSLLLPANQAAQAASVRIEQLVAFLATVEALRMHAAEHGEFPESLQNLHPVPALIDPVTGKLFEYERISETEAKLERQVVSGETDTTLHLKLRQ